MSKQKVELRQRAIAARDAAASRHGSTAAGARLAEAGLDALALPPRGVVSGFLAIGQEIDPVPLMQRLASEGYGLCLPVMVGKGKPLVFRAWAPGDALQERMWGIREPLPEKPEVLPDVLLVPLLAVDAEGWRLGYGGGFYDRTLRALRAVKCLTAIGIAFDEQKVDAVPHLDYDEPLDWVLTPSGPMRCRRA
jgi:5-formyltetrahydrofolate cyclo-ligase